MTIATCQACDQSYDGHPFCALCKCFHHMPARYDRSICQSCDRTLAHRSLRRCTIGGEVKPITAFQKSPGTYYRACLACRSARPKAREWARRNREKHKEEYRLTRQARYQENPEFFRERNRAEYRARHEARLASAAKWRAANRKKHAENSRRWRAENRARFLAGSRARYQKRKLKGWWGC